MKNRLTAIGDLLPLAAGVGLLGGAAWLLWDGSAARQETAPPPGQVAANIGPIGSVRVAEPEPTPSATAATPPPAVPVEPAEQDAAPETYTAAASVDTTAAAREPEPLPPTAEPPAPAPAVSAAEQAAPAPERPAQGPSETAATDADAPHPASVQAEPGKDRETSRPQVPPPAPVAPEAPETPPGAAAALELMPDPYGWHGTYVHTPRGITLFPHRIGSPGTAAAAPGVRRGMFWTTPEGKVYFEPAPGTPSATGTPPPPGRR